MRIATFALAAATALTAAGCTGVSTVGHQAPQFRTAHNNYAMNGRDVFTIVQGGGYGAEQAAFRQAVLESMQRNRAGLKTHFTATPTNNPNSDYKVVMLFNGPTTVQADDLCRRPEQYASVAPVSGDETHVLAAFCQFDSPLTHVDGRAAGVTTVADATFHALIRQTMTDLFPSRDEHTREGSDNGGTIP